MWWCDMVRIMTSEPLDTWWIGQSYSCMKFPAQKETVLEVTVGIWPLTENAFCPKEYLKINKNIRQFYQKKKIEASLPDSQPLAFLVALWISNAQKSLFRSLRWNQLFVESLSFCVLWLLLYLSVKVMLHYNDKVLKFLCNWTSCSYLCLMDWLEYLGYFEDRNEGSGHSTEMHPPRYDYLRPFISSILTWLVCIFQFLHRGN